MNLEIQDHQIPVQFSGEPTQLDDKIDDLVLQHCLRVEIGDQERDVVSLQTR